MFKRKESSDLTDLQIWWKTDKGPELARKKQQTDWRILGSIDLIWFEMIWLVTAMTEIEIILLFKWSTGGICEKKKMEAEAMASVTEHLESSIEDRTATGRYTMGPVRSRELTTATEEERPGRRVNISEKKIKGSTVHHAMEEDPIQDLGAGSSG